MSERRGDLAAGETLHACERIRSERTIRGAANVKVGPGIPLQIGHP
jgi:hypothetical protein